MDVDSLQARTPAVGYFRALFGHRFVGLPADDGFFTPFFKKQRPPGDHIYQFDQISEVKEMDTGSSTSAVLSRQSGVKVKRECAVLPRPSPDVLR